ncbi:HAD-IC family P-type ATPase [Bifidobacterium sp. SMB2]|uniref:HAD-IC family P-type ATPase n=1 Tax=Bifidobacterium saimiriisciurei TaxID=2661627 RepID=A0ABX0CA55_9BIFI|nr:MULTISPECIES: HAD-IC family P-type ATPase [Bifidobacterium]NEG95805.1 HAD-IC family P-type ATPase [Bifidobacterium sp. SMB2]NEH11232.1 HAD-IC family P-type ATPase [Bifidobacterium saimiriisciurei]
MPETGEMGLTGEQVKHRIAQGEINIAKDKSSRSIAQIVRANVFTLFNAIIAVAMVMVLLTGQWRDSVFGFVIIINTGIGIVTELRAKRTLDRLSILVASKYLVRRDGKDVEIAHNEIVKDDLLWIRSGDQIPADVEIVRTWGLELDESMLTGESRTVRKTIGDLAYSGSTAVSGMALGRVTAVGEHSYAARLAAEARIYKKTHSDLNAGINTILKFMTFLVVPLCALLIWTQMNTVGGWDAAIATGSWRQAVVSAVAGVVGMIPEGLVLLTSLNFAVAAMRLARRNTLVQELESVETLARVDALNLDKTGTVTDGGIAFDRLEMLAADGSDETARREAEQALCDLANEEQPNGTGKAILAGLGERGIVAGEVTARVPFSSARKWSAVVADGEIWYMGAPEVLISAMRGDHDDILERVNGIAGEGSRVVLLARADTADADGGAAPETFADDPRLLPDTEPVALVVCSERIRSDAERTLAWFREQGVRCRLISGDNPRTVAAIAGKVRLTGDKTPRYMDARELPADIDELAETLENIDVLGRVLPDQKKAIVQALHRRGHTVAMTGDGVNDTLALKEADLGIAMGNAAPAAKAVAQVVLVDSKFSHLPDVVARGRQVMANMERVASLFLVKTVYSAIISLGVVLSAMPYPYLPRHITYVGALTIGMPAFILALAPNTRRYIPGFLRRVVAFALPGGIATGLSVLLCAWIVPRVMGWNLENPADLESLRATSAIILFLMGVFVLSRVARPLNSWRGGLVALFAACGVIGMFIPFVASFFALIIPTGRTLAATLVALVIASVIFLVCIVVVPKIGRIIPHETKTR